MNIEMRIPESEWEQFKGMVLSKNFMSNNATLTKHNIEEISDFVFAGFSSEHKDDIDYVKSILPDGGTILKWGGHNA